MWCSLGILLTSIGGFDSPPMINEPLDNNHTNQQAEVSRLKSIIQMKEPHTVGPWEELKKKDIENRHMWNKNITEEFEHDQKIAPLEIEPDCVVTHQDREYIKLVKVGQSANPYLAGRVPQHTVRDSSCVLSPASIVAAHRRKPSC